MKNIILLSILLLPVAQANAQKNTFEFGLNKNRAYNYFTKHVLDPNYRKDMLSIKSLEFRYYRSVSSKFSLLAQYIRLPAIDGNLMYALVGYIAEENNGKLIEHLRYNFFDLGVQYNVFQYKQHRFSANGGISLAYGTDEYLEKSYWIYGPGYPEMGHAVYIEFGYKKATYWGGFAGLKYDYLFFQNRINIGPEFAARYYINGFPYQLSYGLHVGLNF